MFLANSPVPVVLLGVASFIPYILCIRIIEPRMEPRQHIELPERLTLRTAFQGYYRSFVYGRVPFELFVSEPFELLEGEREYGKWRSIGFFVPFHPGVTYSDSDDPTTALLRCADLSWRSGLLFYNNAELYDKNMKPISHEVLKSSIASALNIDFSAFKELTDRVYVVKPNSILTTPISVRDLLTGNLRKKN